MSINGRVVQSDHSDAGKPVIWKFNERNFKDIRNEYEIIKSEYARGSKHFQTIVKDHSLFADRYPSLFRFATSQSAMDPENDAVVQQMISQAEEARKNKKTNMDTEATEHSYRLFNRFGKQLSK